jgi:hypothetical protein
VFQCSALWWDRDRDRDNNLIRRNLLYAKALDWIKLTTTTTYTTVMLMLMLMFMLMLC